jgi:chondroitin 4-sulfotransferase 11
MGLLREKKLLFCHIAKNGGQTVHQIMEKLDNLEYYDNHYSLIMLKEQINNDKLFNECLKFCIVRNPWDRMVSTYFFRRDRKENDFGPKKQWTLDFNNWIKYIYSDEYKNQKNTHCVDVVKYHYGSSLRWVVDENNNIIANKIIKFENIDTELSDLFKMHGYTGAITKNNWTRHKHYRNYYNEENKKLVSENFKEDIEYFKYEF